MSTTTVTDARDNLSEIVEKVCSSGEEYVITKHGRPVAVILSYDEYEALVESLNILSDDSTMDALAEAAADAVEGRTTSR